MKRFATLLLLAPALASLSFADDVYDNLSASPVTGANFFSGEVGVQIAPTFTGNLTGFTVWVVRYNHILGGPDPTSLAPASFTVKLYGDSDGRIGSLLGSFGGLTTTQNFAVNGFNTPALVEVAGSGVKLNAGSKYWTTLSSTFKATGNAPYIDGLLYGNVVAQGSHTVEHNNYAVTGEAIGLKVHTDGVPNPVPEPAPFLALSFGTLALLRRGRA